VFRIEFLRPPHQILVLAHKLFIFLDRTTQPRDVSHHLAVSLLGLRRSGELYALSRVAVEVILRPSLGVTVAGSGHCAIQPPGSIAAAQVAAICARPIDTVAPATLSAALRRSSLLSAARLLSAALLSTLLAALLTGTGLLLTALLSAGLLATLLLPTRLLSTGLLAASVPGLLLLAVLPTLPIAAALSIL